MLDRIKLDVVKYVLTVSVRTEQDVQAVEAPEAVSNVKYQHADYEEALAATAADGDVAVAPPPPFTRAGEKSAATIRVRAGAARNTSTATDDFNLDRVRLDWLSSCENTDRPNDQSSLTLLPCLFGTRRLPPNRFSRFPA